MAKENENLESTEETVEETVEVKNKCPKIIFEWISGVQMKVVLGH